jgi:hypothetical protein
MFLLMPDADPNVAVLQFDQTDLRVNYLAATLTLRRLYDGHISDDPIISSNAWYWETNVMRLAEYTELMAKTLKDHGWDRLETEQDWSGYLNFAASDPDQEMTWPWWVGDDAVHEAHRGYLVYSNPGIYAPIWPRVKPHIMPYPGMTTAHTYRHQS